MARLQVAGRLRQVPEVVDFERAATFTKPEKRGLERRRLTSWNGLQFACVVETRAARGGCAGDSNFAFLTTSS